MPTGARRFTYYRPNDKVPFGNPFVKSQGVIIKEPRLLLVCFFLPTDERRTKTWSQAINV